jgi:hypothetical protein
MSICLGLGIAVYPTNPPAVANATEPLEVLVTQRISGLPADANQDYVDRKTHPSEIEHIDLFSIWRCNLPDPSAGVR